MKTLCVTIAFGIYLLLSGCSSHPCKYGVILADGSWQVIGTTASLDDGSRRAWQEFDAIAKEGKNPQAIFVRSR